MKAGDTKFNDSRKRAPNLKSSELLPCPFCGSKAIYRSTSGLEFADGYLDHWINCSNCIATTKWESRHEDDGQSQSLIEAWNQRAEHPDSKRLDWLLMHLTYPALTALGIAYNSDILMDTPDDMARAVKSRIDAAMQEGGE